MQKTSSKIFSYVLVSISFGGLKLFRMPERNFTNVIMILRGYSLMDEHQGC